MSSAARRPRTATYSETCVTMPSEHHRLRGQGRAQRGTAADAHQRLESARGVRYRPCMATRPGPRPHRPAPLPGPWTAGWPWSTVSWRWRCRRADSSGPGRTQPRRMAMTSVKATAPMPMASTTTATTSATARSARRKRVRLLRQSGCNSGRQGRPWPCRCAARSPSGRGHPWP